jgi:pSer/pThr/pTyr-binding forkhead associated (FHA) protein
MPLTVVVRSGSSGEARLTFDGTQRIVLGRGAGCDVRLPDATVSLRHATLRAQGADFVVIDEGSANGTFVGGVRVSPRTSRIVRSGDVVRLGRVWIELRVDRSPVTRDLAAATRDLALALVSEALDAVGTDRTARLRVVEGQDQGATLALAEEGRVYVIGRGPECDLMLADADASREHAHVVRRGSSVLLRDLDAKNGTWLGEIRVAHNRDVPWRSAQVLQVGRTAIALEEPVGEALAEIESAPDHPMPADEPLDPPPAPPAAPGSQPRVPEPSSVAPLAALPEAETQAPAPRPGRSGWTPADLVVVAAALGVLALSIAGLYWLLRG